MKQYRIDYTANTRKALRKLDPGIRVMILKWVDKNLEGCSNPRAHGKALTGNFSGLWRYRVGDYRLIAEIQDDRLVILMLQAGHRREIYS
jgi:mRNA interferase RelE/StbE